MLGNGWIYTAYSNSGDGVLYYVLDRKNNWCPISTTIPNPRHPSLDEHGMPISDTTHPDYEPKFISKLNPNYDGGTSREIDKYLPLDANDIQNNFNQALLLLDDLTSVEEARSQQGEYQKLWLDREVRMERVTTVVKYPAI
ncbi:MAG: hypothetical protein ACO37W_11200 [Prochlorotrichaceae cyanobacterium]